MARRNRRRSRPRHSVQGHLHSAHTSISSTSTTSSYSSGYPYSWTASTSPHHYRAPTSTYKPTAKHWQNQWEAWQSKRYSSGSSASSSSGYQRTPAFRGAAEPSVKSNNEIVRHRLQLFGGEERDGTSLCGPMLQVVMDLFDGGLDYADP